MASTLFDKYGGFSTFSTIVSNFYQKVLDSEQLEPYFSGIDMDSLMNHQTNFLAKALGGPDQYKGRNLKAVHAQLNISLPDFEEVVELLAEALDEGGVEAADIESIVSVVTSLQDKIVNLN